ncbi:MAG TPA: hypothetical protein VFS54_08290 [Solirubrobacterales bacterium]|nr:hypothetical protein [Solirubrobacterales bacterium]
MNAERLHAIARALREEVTQTEYPGHLEQLAEGLEKAVEAPNQPGPQEQVSTARENLNNVLRVVPSNSFSPAWEEALEVLGVADIVGEPLLERVEEILTANEITPNTAHNEIVQIRDRVTSFVATLNQVISAFEFFGIGWEELPPGEFEIGFLIPKVEVDHGLEELGKEFVKLKRIIGPFSELAGEGRPEVKVRSISSSEFQVFLDSAPATAALFTAALERVLAVYKQVLDIRQKHQELSENSDLPEEAIRPIAEAASEMMEKKTREIAEELVAEADTKAEERNNELLTEIRLQLNALAERIDRGYNVEVRAGELPESTDEGEPGDDLDPATRKATEAVLEAQKSIEFMNVSGKPILSLEQADEDEEDSQPEDSEESGEKQN